MTDKKRYSVGFTIIELMLAMAFLSILLLAIAMLTIQISNIYNRGITLREVNLAGSEVSNDIQRSIQASSVFRLTDIDEGIGEVQPSDSLVYFMSGPDSTPTGGRLCLGRYTYAWNYGVAIAGMSGDIKNKYSDGAPVKFTKVPDARQLCIADDDGKYQPIPEGAIDMLEGASRDIVVHELSVASNGDGLYRVSLMIGTNNTDAIIDEACRPPADIASDINYCAINSFHIVAKAGS